MLWTIIALAVIVVGACEIEAEFTKVREEIEGRRATIARMAREDAQSSAFTADLQAELTKAREERAKARELWLETRVALAESKETIDAQAGNIVMLQDTIAARDREIAELRARIAGADPRNVTWSEGL